MSAVHYIAYFCPMLTLYGIKNCDTMQKAFKWLDAKKIKYVFHDYKESGIDKATLETWLNHFPAGKLINTKSTTYRGLTEGEKAGINNKQKTIQVMMKNTSVIKRPVWNLGDGNFYLGWNEEEMGKLLRRFIH
jgi:arsenate reductase (glutaredoxin)